MVRRKRGESEGIMMEFVVYGCGWGMRILCMIRLYVGFSFVKLYDNIGFIG